jgi:hypothetical protein
MLISYKENTTHLVGVDKVSKVYLRVLCKHFTVFYVNTRAFTKLAKYLL